MKKIWSAILVLIMIVLVGCSDSKPVNGVKEEIKIPVYDENSPLFICQDRADIEGDRSFIYTYNYKGDLLDTIEYQQIGLYGKNGLAPAVDPVTELVGFVDQGGVFAIDPQWYDAGSFSDDGIALVVEYDEENWDKKYGYINEKGEQIVPCVYDYATSFYPKGYAIVAVDDGALKWGVIDKTGEIVVEAKYAYIEHITADAIVCEIDATDHQVIYDLSGNLLYDETDLVIDEITYYTYRVCGEKLYRLTNKKVDAPIHKDTWNIITADIIKVEVFEGDKFVDQNENLDIRIESKRVATTVSGYGYGVLCGDETVIPFEYDNIIVVEEYYIAVKYDLGDGESQILDIYDKDFQKTAENLPYNFFARFDSVGDNIALPAGYFDVYVYDEQTGENVHGIVDYTGQIIVPFLYYRGIHLYTYEDIGGQWVMPSRSNVNDQDWIPQS